MVNRIAREGKKKNSHVMSYVFSRSEGRELMSRHLQAVKLSLFEAGICEGYVTALYVIINCLHLINEYEYEQYESMNNMNSPKGP